MGTHIFFMCQRFPNPKACSHVGSGEHVETCEHAFPCGGQGFTCGNVSSQCIPQVSHKCHVNVMYMPCQQHVNIPINMGIINEWPYQVLTLNLPQKLEIFRVHRNFCTPSFTLHS